MKFNAAKFSLETHVPSRNCVLAIDGNEVERNLLRARFLIADVDFLLLENAHSALDALAQSRPFTMIIADMRMSDMEFSDFIDSVGRVMGDRPIPPIVATSAFETDSQRESCIDAGVADYLAKPYSQSDFETMLQQNLKAPAMEPAYRDFMTA